MRLDELTYEECQHIPVTAVAELREYELGDTVEVDGETGMIAAFVEKTFSWDTAPDEDGGKEKIEASEDNPTYIVALLSGGSVPAKAGDLSEGSIESDEGKEINSFKEVKKGAEKTELSPVYEYTSNPDSISELRHAKKTVAMDKSRAELAQYTKNEGLGVHYWESTTVEELLNIPGVDDPEVGFSDLPDGWTRKSVLQAWASLGGQWRTCHAQMTKEMGPRMSKRFCSALKDEVLGTEQWRNKF